MKTDNARAKIDEFVKNGFDKLPICVAKTQYSLTDDQKVLGNPRNFTMTVTDARLSNGAGFIVLLMGAIMTMPGLSKEPAYMKMKFHTNGNIDGLY